MSIKRKCLILLIFFALIFNVLSVSSYTGQTTSVDNISKELAECRVRLIVLNKTLENITKERDYYKALYENMTVNITNIELIQIRNEINILNQEIEQLNTRITSLEKNIITKKYLVFGVTISSIVGSIFGSAMTIKYIFKKNNNEENDQSK